MYDGTPAQWDTNRENESENSSQIATSCLQHRWKPTGGLGTSHLCYACPVLLFVDSFEDALVLHHQACPVLYFQ